MESTVEPPEGTTVAATAVAATVVAVYTVAVIGLSAVAAEVVVSINTVERLSAIRTFHVNAPMCQASSLVVLTLRIAGQLLHRVRVGFRRVAMNGATATTGLHQEPTVMMVVLTTRNTTRDATAADSMVNGIGINMGISMASRAADSLVNGMGLSMGNATVTEAMSSTVSELATPTVSELATRSAPRDNPFRNNHHPRLESVIVLGRGHMNGRVVMSVDDTDAPTMIAVKGEGEGDLGQVGTGSVVDGGVMKRETIAGV